MERERESERGAAFIKALLSQMHVEFSLIQQARGGGGVGAPRWRELKINRLLKPAAAACIGNVPFAAAQPVAYTRPFNLSNCRRNAPRVAREPSENKRLLRRASGFSKYFFSFVAHERICILWWGAHNDHVTLRFLSNCFFLCCGEPAF